MIFQCHEFVIKLCSLMSFKILNISINLGENNNLVSFGKEKVDFIDVICPCGRWRDYSFFPCAHLFSSLFSSLFSINL